MLALNQLCGFGAGGIAPPTSVSFITSTTATTNTIAAPSGILAGDILVALQYATGIGDPGTAFPSGFTVARNYQPASTIKRVILSWKVCDGTESGATLSGMTGIGGTGWVVMHFRPDNPAGVATVGAGSGDSSSDTNPAGITVAASGGVAPLIVFGGYVSSGAVNPRTFTVGGSAAKDGEANSTTSNYLAYKIYNSSPADVVIDIDDEGDDNGVCGFYLQIA